MKTFLLSLLLTLNVFASDWKHLDHEDKGIFVSLSYKKVNNQGLTMAAPLHVNIKGQIRPDSHVRVIVTSLESGPSRRLHRESFGLDLARQPEGHFWSEFSNAKRMIDMKHEVSLRSDERSLVIHGENIFYLQEIVVLVDGQMVDHFTVNLYQH